MGLSVVGYYRGAGRGPNGGSLTGSCTSQSVYKHVSVYLHNIMLLSIHVGSVL